MEIITGISSAIALVRQILALPGLEKNAELRLLIADLQIKLAEVQSKMAETMAENHQLRDALTQATAPPDVIHKNGVYWKTNGDGPFCVVCRDASGKMLRLTELPKNIAEDGRYFCNTCQGRFQPQ